MINLKVKIPGMELKNPVMPASGCFGFGHQWAKHYDLNILGSIMIKSATLETRVGHPNPNFIKTDAGWLNAIGLANPGLEKIMIEELPKLAEVYDSKVIANVAGKTYEEYIEVAKKISTAPNVGALELNISCPNVKEGSMAFGVDPKATEELTRKVKDVSSVPVYVKLSPNVTDVVKIALAAQKGGADAITMINTLVGMELNYKTGKPKLSNGTGGVSGKAVFLVAIRQVYEVSQAVDIPVIGMGGIESAKDVITMMSAGASAVAIGSINYLNAKICKQIIEDLPKELEKLGVSDINEIVGRAWK